MAYEQAIRTQALRLLSNGMTPEEVSRRMGGRPCPMTVRNWAKDQTVRPSSLRNRKRGAATDGAKTPRRAKYLCQRSTPLVRKIGAMEQLAAGRPVADVAAEVGVNKYTLYGWARDYRALGVEGLMTVTEYNRLAQMAAEIRTGAHLKGRCQKGSRL